jgi:SAM-dependent methyltransferase
MPISEVLLNNIQSDSQFDKYYYTHCCGANYLRSDEWLGFFRHVASRLVLSLAPRRVLDAGCAKGFLVEALREAGVEADGIDISEYAISQAHESIRPYLKVQSLTQVIGAKYDLVVSIEVLEHMNRHDALVAIERLCSSTDDIIFSSSPFDYGEPTHINVHPPEYWSAEFARHGFFRDLDFDCSFLTPWACRFRRKALRIEELVTQYERRFWELSQAEQGSRKHATEVQAQLSQLQSMLDEENASGKTVAEHIVELKQIKAKMSGIIEERDAYASELAAIKLEQREFWDSRAGALIRLIRGGRRVLSNKN